MSTKVGFIVGALAALGITGVLIRQELRIRELSALVGQAPLASAEPSRVRSRHTALPAAGALDARVERLEGELDELRQALRIQQLVRAARPAEPTLPGAKSAGSSAVEASEGESGASGPARAETALMDALDSDSPQLRERFRALVQEEQERLSDERREQRETRLAERAHERIGALAAKVHLSDAQVALLEEALDTEREKVFDLFAQAREDLSFPEARAKARTLRAATDARLERELDPGQFAAYQEMREEERVRFGPPPGGPDIRRSAPGEP
jgi:hypothetical protein